MLKNNYRLILMNRFFAHIIFCLPIICYINVAKAKYESLKLSSSTQKSAQNIIKYQNNDFEQANSLSLSTKKILNNIYLRSNSNNKESRNKNIFIEKMHNDSDVNYYDTIKGNPSIDIEIKKPNEILLQKRKAYEKAFAAIESGSFETAIILFEKLLQNYPKDKFIITALASAYQQLGEDKLAYKYYARALALFPNDKLLFNNFLLLVAKESPEEALAEFLKLDNIYPKSDFLKAQIAYLFTKSDNFEQALNYIQSAILLNKQNSTYYFYKAVILDKMNLKHKALPIYAAILNSGSYKNIGVNKSVIKQRINELSS